MANTVVIDIDARTKQFESALDDLTYKVESTAAKIDKAFSFSGADKSFKSASNAVKGFGNEAQKAFGIINQAGAVAMGIFGEKMFSGAINGIRNFSSEIISAVDQMQMLEKSMQSITTAELVKASNGQLSYADALSQSSAQAKELMGWLRDLSIVSPYGYQAVADVFKANANMGQSTKIAKKTTKAILNLSAGLGLTAQQMSGLGNALAQTSATGVINKTDIRQFANNGFGLDKMNDVFKQISANTNVAISDYQEFNKAVEAGKITTDDFFIALEQYSEMNYGGSVQGMATTIAGLRGTLDDIAFFAKTDIFKPLGDSFAAAIAPIIGTISDWLGAGDFEGLGQQVLQFAQPVIDALANIGAEFESGAIKLAIENLIGYMTGEQDNLYAVAETLERIGGTEFALEGVDKLETLKNAINWIIDNKTEIIGALQGIGVTLLALMAFKTLSDILNALTNPLVWIVALGALFGIAWSQNLGDVQGKWEALKEKVTEVIENLKGKFNELKSAWESNGIAGVIGVLKQDFAEAFSSLGQTLETELAKIPDTVSNWLATNEEKLKSNTIDIAVALFGEGAAEKVQAFFDTLDLQGKWNALVETFNKTKANIDEIISEETWSDAKDSILLIIGIFALLGKVVSSMVTPMIDLLGNAITGAIDWASKLFDLLSDVKKLGQDIASGNWDEAGKDIGSIADSYKNLIESVSLSVQQLFADILTAVVTGISAMIGGSAGESIMNWWNPHKEDFDRKIQDKRIYGSDLVTQADIDLGKTLRDKQGTNPYDFFTYYDKSVIGPDAFDTDKFMEYTFKRIDEMVANGTVQLTYGDNFTNVLRDIYAQAGGDLTKAAEIALQTVNEASETAKETATQTKETVEKTLKDIDPQGNRVDANEAGNKVLENAVNTANEITDNAISIFDTFDDEWQRLISEYALENEITPEEAAKIFAEQLEISLQATTDTLTEGVKNSLADFASSSGLSSGRIRISKSDQIGAKVAGYYAPNRGIKGASSLVESTASYLALNKSLHEELQTALSNVGLQTYLKKKDVDAENKLIQENAERLSIISKGLEDKTSVFYQNPERIATMVADVIGDMNLPDNYGKTLQDIFNTKGIDARTQASLISEILGKLDELGIHVGEKIDENAENLESAVTGGATNAKADKFDTDTRLAYLKAVQDNYMSVNADGKIEYDWKGLKDFSYANNLQQFTSEELFDYLFGTGLNSGDDAFASEEVRAAQKKWYDSMLESAKAQDVEVEIPEKFTEDVFEAITPIIPEKEGAEGEENPLKDGILSFLFGEDFNPESLATAFKGLSEYLTPELVDSLTNFLAIEMDETKLSGWTMFADTMTSVGTALQGIAMAFGLVGEDAMEGMSAEMGVSMGASLEGSDTMAGMEGGLVGMLTALAGMEFNLDGWTGFAEALIPVQEALTTVNGLLGVGMEEEGEEGGVGMLGALQAIMTLMTESFPPAVESFSEILSETIPEAVDTALNSLGKFQIKDNGELGASQGNTLYTSLGAIKGLIEDSNGAMRTFVQYLAEFIPGSVDAFKVAAGKISSCLANIMAMANAAAAAAWSLVAALEAVIELGGGGLLGLSGGGGSKGGGINGGDGGNPLIAAAGGTSGFRYGTAIVGEHGPELVTNNGSRAWTVFSNNTLMDEIAHTRHALNALSNSAEIVAYNRLMGGGASTSTTDNSQTFTNNIDTVVGDSAFKDLVDDYLSRAMRRELLLAR